MGESFDGNVTPFQRPEAETGRAEKERTTEAWREEDAAGVIADAVFDQWSRARMRPDEKDAVFSDADSMWAKFAGRAQDSVNEAFDVYGISEASPRRPEVLQRAQERFFEKVRLSLGEEQELSGNKGTLEQVRRAA